MSDDDETGRRIGRDAERKERARRETGHSPLRGLAVFGMVGWSVAVPTLGGIFLGLWLDRNWPADFSWTITLLVAGVLVGAALAWRWIARER